MSTTGPPWVVEGNGVSSCPNSKLLDAFNPWPSIHFGEAETALFALPSLQLRRCQPFSGLRLLLVKQGSQASAQGLGKLLGLGLLVGLAFVFDAQQKDSVCHWSSIVCAALNTGKVADVDKQLGALTASTHIPWSKCERRSTQYKERCCSPKPIRRIELHVKKKKEKNIVLCGWAVFLQSNS